MFEQIVKEENFHLLPLVIFNMQLSPFSKQEGESLSTIDKAENTTTGCDLYAENKYKTQVFCKPIYKF